MEVTTFSKGSERKIEVPQIVLPKSSCSAFVRLAAKEIFGKEYSISDAWDRRYRDRVVCPVFKNSQLAELVDGGTMTPGMILGLYNPFSPYNFKLDMTGHPVFYTHVALYLGSDRNKQIIFAEQRGKRIKTSTPRSLSISLFRAIEVLDSKN